MVKTKFIFATDIHGSETVWRKFLNCAKMFNLDALVLSGDMTGKVIVPIVERADGRYNASLLGTPYTLSKEEVPDFMKRCRMVSYIPYVTNPDEAKIFESDSEKREKLFEKLEVEIVKYWMDLVPEKVPKNCGVIISPGNDDKFAIDDAIRDHPAVIYGEEKVVPLDDEHEVACCAWSNPTPFNSPRECSEEELLEKLDAVISQIKSMKTAIFCFHVPPYRSEIDTAPLLDKEMRPLVIAGQLQTGPAGSKAVRQIIEKYQPLLGLHGHIHESPGYIKIGRTQCINPGSEYGEGIFKGFMVEVDGEKVKKLQKIEG